MIQNQENVYHFTRAAEGGRQAAPQAVSFPLPQKTTAGMPAPLSPPAPPSAWIRRLAASSWTWGEWRRGQNQRLEAAGVLDSTMGSTAPLSPALPTGSPYVEHPLARAGRRRAATACPWAAGKRYPWQLSHSSCPYLPVGPVPPLVPTPTQGALSTGSRWRHPAGQGAPPSCPSPGSQTAARAPRPPAAPPPLPAPLNMRASALRSQLLR